MEFVQLSHVYLHGFALPSVCAGTVTLASHSHTLSTLANTQQRFLLFSSNLCMQRTAVSLNTLPSWSFHLCIYLPVFQCFENVCCICNSSETVYQLAAVVSGSTTFQTVIDLLPLINARKVSCSKPWLLWWSAVKRVHVCVCVTCSKPRQWRSTEQCIPVPVDNSWGGEDMLYSDVGHQDGLGFAWQERWWKSTSSRGNSLSTQGLCNLWVRSAVILSVCHTCQNW